MSEYTREIKKDIDMFQGYVQKMSSKIQSASIQWNDEQYTSLAKGISCLAHQSKDLLIIGDKLCESVDKFFVTANQDYG